MLQDDTRWKIENIVAGNVVEGAGNNCQAIRDFLCRRFATSTTVKKNFESKSVVKKEQERIIAQYCDLVGVTPSWRGSLSDTRW